MAHDRRTMFRIALAACIALAGVPSAFAQGAQPPIRIGSTLALTGPLAATSLVHKVVGEIYVEQLNKRGGLLGRPVEWIVRDDQSKPDLARTERHEVHGRKLARHHGDRLRGLRR